MSDGESLRIAVMSDLHVFTQADPGKAPSYLRTQENVPNPLENPLHSLELLVSTEPLKADLLLSPGDLCDRADPQALQFGWQKVKDIADKLGAKLVVGTVGNHDVDSSHLNEIDAWAGLKRLPDYPTDDESLSNEYWARHFTVLHNTAKDYRLVVLNSSAYHGQIDIEKNHGRVNDQTLRELNTKLAREAPPAINVLLCHHHPHQHSEVLLGEDDWMKSGQLLLDLLGTANLGSWMVIHGHKHHPKLTYAAGGGASPVVFAAGSLGAHLFPQLSTRTKNQFHIITLDLDRCRKCGLSGWIQSWSFSFGLGWLIPDGAMAGLPHRAGFGFRNSPRELAQRVAPHVGAMTDWKDVVEAIDDIDFLLPQDLSAMKYHLKKDHGVTLWEEGTIVRKASKA